MKKMTLNEAMRVRKDFMEEFNRLLSTGAISDKTTRQTVYRVALENLSERYILQIEEYQNLRQF